MVDLFLNLTVNCKIIWVSLNLTVYCKIIWVSSNLTVNCKIIWVSFLFFIAGSVSITYLNGEVYTRAHTFYHLTSSELKCAFEMRQPGKNHFDLLTSDICPFWRSLLEMIYEDDWKAIYWTEKSLVITSFRCMRILLSLPFYWSIFTKQCECKINDC